MLTSLFIDLLTISISTSFVIFGLKLLSPLLSKNYAAKWKFWMWMILALRLLLPINVTLDNHLLQIQVPESPINKATLVNQANLFPSVNTSIPTNAIPAIQQTEEVMNSTPSLLSILALLWLFGFVLYLLYHFIGYYLFKKQAARWSRPILTKRNTSMIQQVMTEMGIAPSLSVRTSEKVPNPMLVGFWKPILFLPHENYTDHELELIMKHELIHYKRHDIVYKLLLLVVQALHWFNPFVWLMIREAKREIENYCDETVVHNQSLTYRIKYCETIISAIQKHDTRSMALVTNFTGGKQSMKLRFMNILNMKKKRNGTVLFSSVILSVILIGTLVACTSIHGEQNYSQLKQGTIYSRSFNGEQIKVYDAGNSYSIDQEGNVLVSYRNGDVIATIPLNYNKIWTSTEANIENTGFYISEDKTAIVYGYADDKTSPLHVLISHDEGTTWHDYEIQDSKGYDTKFIGFTTKNDGWIVSGGSAGVGRSLNYVYQTSDGGKTWSELGNPNDLYAEQLTGAGFSTKEIGFLGFRYYADNGPVVYWTKDKGQSWEKLSVSLPRKFHEYQKTPLSPIFNGKEGLFPILLSKEANVIGTIYLSSKDEGLTWTYDASYDQLHDF